ncbi:DUF2490 domain-containing protein [Sphingomonas sp.]|jgi:hypothetical protein|uniref:DUF2490 domain-containing protein n=1 Tax=Sphingomonas sp. TaxID=28214 RepID=UPI002E305A7D|nr:DUF2490 domain-containing protein [Sphingomonas sp.]HEX4695956.1 DUF2490 domain-containing protein [Sphingomonas sp.]
MRLPLPLAALAILIPGAAFAKDGEVWTSAGASGSLGGDWRASVDGIARFDGDGLYEWVASGAIGYRLDRHATVWAGYVYKTAYASNAATNEQRVREDLTLDDIARIGPVRIGGRLRGEERWREGRSGLGWRARPMLRLTLPLRKDGPALVAGAEGFFNLGSGAGQRRGYDRIRESIGVQLPLAKAVRLDAGYLRQWTRGAGTIGAATLGLAYKW